MSPLRLSLLACLLSAGITSGAFHIVHRQRAREADHLRFANHRMRFEANRRNQAATPMPPPPIPPAETRKPDPAATVPGPAPAAAAAAAGDYRNDGQATPVATLQTFAWACDRGDAETVAKLVLFEEGARSKVNAFLATQPDAARTPGRSPDDLAAAALTSAIMDSPFPSSQILDTASVEQLSADRVILRLPHTPKDRTQYQKVGDVWKYVITEAMVDHYLRQAAAAPVAR